MKIASSFIHPHIVSNLWTGYILKIELWIWKIVIESLSKLNWISQIYEQIIQIGSLIH